MGIDHVLMTTSGHVWSCVWLWQTGKVHSFSGSLEVRIEQQKLASQKTLRGVSNYGPNSVARKAVSEEEREAEIRVILEEHYQNQRIRANAHLHRAMADSDTASAVPNAVTTEAGWVRLPGDDARGLPDHLFMTVTTSPGTPASGPSLAERHARSQQEQLTMQHPPATSEVIDAASHRESVTVGATSEVRDEL
jgi:hypothetical protein